MTQPYTMDIEKPAGTIRQHGYHLGTKFYLAEELILERLRADPEVVSIALRQTGKLVHIYDHRDLKEEHGNDFM